MHRAHWPARSAWEALSLKLELLPTHGMLFSQESKKRKFLTGSTLADTNVALNR